MENRVKLIPVKKKVKFIAAFLAINLIAEVLSPTIALALTSGPSQPETQSFEPAGTSDMVDIFTGDFNYNIPLFDLPGPNGGYPFNLAYHSGIGLDQEASWVGLGWNINPGAINRDKRGLPDDINGELIETELDIKDNVTYGLNLGVGLELWGGDANLGIGVSIYNNSYRGYGYSLDANIGTNNEGMNVGLGLSLDSQEGVGMNAELSMSGKMGKERSGYAGLGVAFNSQRGLSLSQFGGMNKAQKKKSGPSSRTIFSGGGSYTFSDQAYTPTFQSEMAGSNLQVAIKFGLDAAGIFTDLTLGGFYREEGLKNNPVFGYGYNYLEAAGQNGLMDFNREKDGTVRKESPNLPIPSITYDTYMAYGQGYSGSYRAHRNDIGHLHDPKVKSKISGGSIGVDLGFGVPFHVGLAGSFNRTEINSGDWSDENQLVSGGNNNYSYFPSSNVGQHDYEKLYYKSKGEQTSYNTDELNYIGGDLAVRADLEKHGSLLDRRYETEDGRLVSSTGAHVLTTLNGRIDGRGRISRTNSIQPITNELLLNSSSDELLGEYNVSYLNSDAYSNYHYTATPVSYNRPNASPQIYHDAGFTCINPDGLRYVYALPTYNKDETEMVRSIKPDDFAVEENVNYVAAVTGSYTDGETDKFLSKTITPDYAHAYLLTSVLGADYVDLTGNGPSDDDLGYWVKFNYLKTQDNYSWRTPYEGAMYLRGKNYAGYDDKIMYNEGKKEIWYLASAETSSHIAVFDLETRKDGLEAGSTTATLKRIKKIDLFPKEHYNSGGTLTPLKTVHFSYNYDLCPNVSNHILAIGSDNANRGKLTLKEVWFTYQNNSKGSLSPYTFDYHESNPSENPSYEASSDPLSNQRYDRWGNFRENNSDFFSTLNMPYVSQFDPSVLQNATNKNTFQNVANNNVAVWNLKEIGLPTGGRINIEYESDDYAYVQHRQATQMFQILRLSDPANPDRVYPSGSGWTGAKSQPSPQARLYNDYLADLKQEDGSLQMFFRIKSKLRSVSGKSADEFVSGYCDLETGTGDYDLENVQNVDGVNCYTEGYVTLKFVSGHNSATNSGSYIEYHPFAVAAWQYLRVNCGDILTAFGGLSSSASSGSTAGDKALKVASLLSVFPAIMQTLVGYRKYAFNHNWGNTIIKEKSVIRLCSPDKKKLGGGLRVKKITYNDNWNNSSSEASNEYGQIYDYTTTETIGNQTRKISSGVAQYEPLIGGDEIALRHAKKFVESIPMATDNNTYFEYPINESYYPGASVGYSKVTVQSIASKRAMPDGDLDVGINTSGIVEYEFYTAKDFPVITDETDNQMRKFNLYIPIPLIGQINNNKLFGSQGYAIILNDMHGKMKRVSNYAKNINGEKLSVPTNYVEYRYMKETRQYDGRTVNVLKNKVESVIGESIDRNPLNTDTYNKMIANKKNVVIGEEYDFFTDSRKSDVKSEQYGIAFNAEIATVVSIPCPWPTISYNTKKLRTFVTNKVISRTGILEETVANDGESTVSTKNLLFDSYTGEPVLTQVTNDFENPVFNYSHLSKWEYEGMDAAAKNFNYQYYAKINNVTTVSGYSNSYTFDIFNGFIAPGDPGNTTAVNKNPSASLNPYPIKKDDFYNMIAEGDELIIEQVGVPSTKRKVTLITKNVTYDASCGSKYNLAFHSNSNAGLSNGNEFKFTIVRSGRRNLVTSQVGAITALKDPTLNANRGLYAATGTSLCVANELAQLFNTLLNYDCNSIAGNQLPSITLNFSSEEFYDQNGNPLFPVLSSIFHSMTISASVSHPYIFYNISFTYFDGNGNCVPVDCPAVFLAGYISGHNNIYYYDLSNFSSTGCNSIYVSTKPEGGGNMNLACLDSIAANSKYTYIDDVIS
ncbi:MAG: hypothetical protein L6Q66_04910, partial [Bacteroidia bacterium]|nr:hypothetical protein [Bacteroidia bacterium]